MRDATLRYASADALDDADALDADDAGELHRLRRRVAELERRLARGSAPRLFEALMEAMPAPVFYKDTAGVYQGCNRAFAQILELERSEIVGRTLDDLPGLPAAEHRVVDEAVVRDGRSRTYETELVDSRGGRRHVVVHKAPYTGEDERIVGVVGVLLDVSERRRAEEALRASEELRRSITDNAPAYVLLADRDGTIQFINRTQGDLSRSQVIGRPITDFVPAAEAAGVSAAIARVVATGRPVQREIRYTNAAGAVQVFESRFGPVKGDDGEVVALVLNATDVTDRKAAEDELRASEERYRLLAENVSDLICTLDLDLRLTYVSPSASRMLGFPPRRLAGRLLSRLLPEPTVAALRQELDTAIAHGGDGVVTFDLDLRHADRRTVHGEARVTVLRDDAGRPAGGRPAAFLAVVRDITAWRQAQDALRRSEERLRQQQKLEAIGKLAGGVAHDFNNMLTVILGNAQILQLRLPEGDAARREAEEIRRAAERAASLTRQLLAFSRKQVLVPKVLDLNRVVADTETMLRRLIGEDVALETKLAPDLGRVEADPGQLEQVLVNLAVNARDAMPDGGRLVIATQNVAADEGDLPGPAVRLVVSDTGVGIAPEDEARIFEPFFTTKEKGRGTGLGLSMVYGIVQQSNGLVRVRTRPGAGTTFEIDLPRVAGPTHAAAAERAPEPRAGEGSETVLVVEDEPGVRALVARTLTGRGYRVLEASCGDEALRRCADAGAVDLLVTDVVMPGMSGFELAERLADAVPPERVLYMSGHTEDALARHRRGDAPIRLVEKPFAPEALAEHVRAILDAVAR